MTGKKRRTCYTTPLTAYPVGTMADAQDIAGDPTPSIETAQRLYRHPLPTRIFHWVNLVAIVALFMSGLQIFNAHPRLYWGQTGWFNTPSIFEIMGPPDVEDKRSWIGIGGVRYDATGFLGVPTYIEEYGITTRPAFPGFMLLPSRAEMLDKGRGWHFLALYIFSANLLVYYLIGLFTGRFRSTLRPSRDQLGRRAIVADLKMHQVMCHATQYPPIIMNEYSLGARGQVA